MLTIDVPSTELFDEKQNRFVTVKAQPLKLEHSLVSLYKWESKWHKPFLSKDEKTAEQTVDYIRCMTVSTNVDPNVYLCLDSEAMSKISEYISDPMTATTFSDKGPRGQRETITAEIIYYWMVAFQIPFECQKWHLNKLLTLVHVCSIKNQPPKKMSNRAILSQNAALNAARRQRLNTRG